MLVVTRALVGDVKGVAMLVAATVLVLTEALVGDVLEVPYQSLLAKQVHRL
jgi:hypothetical protein